MSRKSPLFVLFITIFIDLLGFGIIIPVLPNFAKGLGASGFTVTAIAGIYSLFQFIFGPFWGTLSDRLGRRPIILVSILVTALSYVLIGFSDSILLLFISRSLSGVGSANISAANAYIADISTPENRTKNMGMIGAAFGLGFIFGPIIGGYLFKDFGMMGVGLFTAGLCVINLIMAWFLLPESLTVFNKDAAFRFKPITDLSEVLKIDTVKQVFWVSFLFVAAFSMMQITAALLWEDVYGKDEVQRGYVFTFIGVCSTIVQGTLVGPLNKIFGEKKLLIGGLSLLSFGIFFIPFVPNYLFFPLEYGCMLLIALANGGISPSILSLVSSSAPKNSQGKVLGLLQSFSALARFVGPPIGGFLYDINFHLPYITGAIIAIFSLILVFYTFKYKIKASE